MNATELLRLIAQNTFREFNRDDWNTYSGAEDGALICETDNYTLIVAGALVSYIVDGVEELYELGHGQ